MRKGDGVGIKLCVLTQGDLSASASSGSRREGNDEMTKRREKSDDFVVPKDSRKRDQTECDRGGKEVTASEAVEQLELFDGTAESPQGTGRDERTNHVVMGARKAPKPSTTKSTRPLAMTIEEIANPALLKQAFAKVASNKGAPGPDRQSIEDVREHLDEITAELSDALLDESYRPGAIRRVWIPKSGGEKRGLGIPNVIDRLVQQAVHLVLQPHFEPKFHDGSHGFRPGRSCHTAMKAAKAHVVTGARIVVDIDLKKFFDRVHHERLLARLESMGVDDRRVIRLVRRMLKAKVVLPNGVVVSNDEGTPQGGPLSPLLSNVVLDELDWELDRRGLRFVRYADDCNVYVGSRRAGERVMASLTRFIERRLRLEVNQDKSAVASPSTRHFVGFRIARTKTGNVQIRLSKRSVKRIRRRITELIPRNWGGSLYRCITQVNRYLKGWVGFFGIVEGEKFTIKILDSHIRRRLRALIFRQKKKRRYIVSFLMKRGVSKDQAMRDVYGRYKRIWKLSISTSAHEAMTSYWFDKQGLLRIRTLRAQLKKRQKRKVGASRQLSLLA